MDGSLVALRTANAMSMTADIKPVVTRFMPTLSFSLDRMRKRNGGKLWVGGTLSVFEDRVSFRPNFVNRLIQDGVASFDLSWVDIDEIGWRKGFLNSIIELRHGDEVEAIRCFGSKALSEKMRTLRSAMTGR
jgi:hypothetical protein